MTRAFGDSYFFLALLNPRDRDHSRAVRMTTGWRGEVVTTRWILAEVADGLAKPPMRELAVNFLLRMEHHRLFRVLAVTEAQFAAGFELYRQRPDKAWSLTDCISFIVMRQEGLREALTGDRHFEQAGFVALLGE